MRWNYEKCKEEALKYTKRVDFLKENKQIYQYAYRHKWLDEICSHMRTTGDKYNRCIYAYEFPNNSVYIGLTYNLDKRNKQHISSDKSSVFIEIKLTGLTPTLKKLSDYIYYEDASKLEGMFVEEYKNNGWTILNKNKTGSLGSSNIIYTKEKCKEIIENCVYLSDLYTNHNRVFSKCKENNWLSKEIDNLIKQKNSNNYWSKENCLKEAKLYDNISDFIEKSGSAYRTSLKNNWLEEITSHMYFSKKGKNYWNYETCKKESLKYKNRFSFQKGSRGAYKAAHKNKWLDDFFI